MTDDFPMGYTRFETDELAGEPHVWADVDGCLHCEMEIEGHEQWIVHAEYSVDTGIDLIGISIYGKRGLSSAPTTQLTTTVYRKVHFDRLFQMASNGLAARQQLGLVVDVDASEFRHNRRPGRAGRPDDFYVGVAARYVELLGTSRSPIEAVAKEMEISRSQARDLIRETRVRGLLSWSERGKKGGQVTEKALRLLAKNQGGEG